MLRQNTSYVVVFCSWEMLSTWENMISLPRMLREHAERTHPVSSFAVDLERTCSQFERRCQSWENMISLPRLREHAERTHPMSIFREHILCRRPTAEWFRCGGTFSEYSGFPWILENHFPSLPLSLSSPYLLPSVPYRAGVVGGVNNVDIYLYIYIYILYIGVDGGVNNAEICVSIPGKGVKGPCFDDLGLPLTASKIQANILQSNLYSDFA